LLREGQQKHLAEALFAASRHKMLRIFFNKGLAGAAPEVLAATRRTSTSPAVLDAFALVIIADGQGMAYPGLTPPTTADPAVARKDRFRSVVERGPDQGLLKGGPLGARPGDQVAGLFCR